MILPTVTIEYPEPVYSLFDTSRAGLPAVVVVNAALGEFAHRDTFPWHLSVIVDAVELADGGLPTRAEVLILDAVDELIDHAVLATRNAMFLARETWNGQRQLVYRVNEPEIAAGALRALIDSRRQAREWEFRMWGDVDWTDAARYLALLDATGRNA